MSKTRYVCRSCGYVEVEDVEAHKKSKPHLEAQEHTNNAVYF